MKRSFKKFIAMLLFITMMGSYSVSAAEVKEVEKNNDTLSVQKLEISDSIALTGSLSKKTDVDWYLYTMPIEGKLVISIKDAKGKLGNNIAYWYTEIFTTGMEPVFSEKWTSGQKEIELGADTYYIKVSKGEEYSSSKYKITLNVQNTSKKKDTWISASAKKKTYSVDIGKYYYSDIKSSKLKDEYSFKVEKDGAVWIDYYHEIINDPKVVFTATIYNSKKEELAFIERSGNTLGTTASRKIGLTPGTYKLVISVKNYSKKNIFGHQYKFAVLFDNSETWETEVNNKKDQADTVYAFDETHASISGKKDKDWYKYQAEGEGKINLSFKNKKEGKTKKYWKVTIYDSKLKKLTSTYFKGGTEEEQYTSDVAVKKGTYYICFEAGETATVYEYSFKVIADYSPNANAKYDKNIKAPGVSIKMSEDNKTATVKLKKKGTATGIQLYLREASDEGENDGSEEFITTVKTNKSKTDYSYSFKSLSKGVYEVRAEQINEKSGKKYYGKSSGLVRFEVGKINTTDTGESSDSKTGELSDGFIVETINEGTGVSIALNKTNGMTGYNVKISKAVNEYSDYMCDWYGSETEIKPYSETSGSLKYEIKGLPAGTYTLKATAYKGTSEEDTDWETKYTAEKTIEINAGKEVSVVPKSYDFSDAKAGDIIKFGSFEQDDNMLNGKEDIEWVVLSRKNDELFLLSKYALACLPKNKEGSTLADLFGWENCSLRNWLNEKFFVSAFTEGERTAIKTTEAYEGIFDNIFLLTPGQATNSAYGFNENEYEEDENRLCESTPYAKMMSGDRDIYCNWWLINTSTVSYHGDIDDEEDRPYLNWIGVRPAMCIDISKIGSETTEITDENKSEPGQVMQGYSKGVLHVTDISPANDNGMYKLTVDIYDYVKTDRKELLNKQVGDKVTICGNEGVITDILSANPDDDNLMTFEYDKFEGKDKKYVTVIVHFDKFVDTFNDNKTGEVSQNELKDVDLGFARRIWDDDRYYGEQHEQMDSPRYYGTLSTTYYGFSDLYYAALPGFSDHNFEIVEKNIELWLSEDTRLCVGDFRYDNFKGISPEDFYKGFAGLSPVAGKEAGMPVNGIFYLKKLEKADENVAIGQEEYINILDELYLDTVLPYTLATSE